MVEVLFWVLCRNAYFNLVLLIDSFFKEILAQNLVLLSCSGFVVLLTDSGVNSACPDIQV